MVDPHRHKRIDGGFECGEFIAPRFENSQVVDLRCIYSFLMLRSKRTDGGFECG